MLFRSVSQSRYAALGKNFHMRSFPRLLSQSEVHMKVFSQFLLIVFLGAASMVASAEDGSERSLNAVK